jgi:hypothetical protein
VHSTDFVTAYPFDIDPEVIHAGEHSQLITEGQQWSYRFGRLLYMVLAGMTHDTLTDPLDMQAYHEWSVGVIDDIITLIGHKNDAAHRAINELNFNVMNHALRGMWYPVLHSQDRWSEGERAHTIRASELELGIIGLVFNQAREAYAKKYGHQIWFEESTLRPLTSTINGILQEIDSAIVLLAIAKRHPSWAILPAPLHFERMGRGNNVDFIVIDCERQNTIGIQVKTRVQFRQRRRADPKRVVFIDGIEDLCNTRELHTQSASDKLETVSWAGMIAVQLIASLPVNKNKRTVNRNMRWFAKRLVQEMPPINPDQAIQKIEQRLLEALSVDA